MRRDELRPVRRGGFTLVEVCLVLALLIVIGSLAIPLLGGSFKRQALTSGADLLRAGLSRARLQAMQSGQPYVLRVQPKGSWYQILSLDQLALPESQALPADNPDAEHSAYDILRLSRNRLPDGVIFAKLDVSDSNLLTATMGSIDGGSWSAPILFRPDGTTSDASVLLVNEPGNTVRVTLRGLTGGSDVSAVGREPVP
jgi:type II secretory pathway pseudopilin PulG